MISSPLRSTAAQTRGPGRLRAALAVLAGTSAALALAPAAPAQEAPLEDVSGADQYIEDVATPRGRTRVGGNTEKPRADALAPRARQRLAAKAGSDAPLLEEVATSPAYGAPHETLGPTADRRPGNRLGRARRDAARQSPVGAASARRFDSESDVSTREALSSAVGALTDSEAGGSSTPLFAALVAITLAMLLAAVWRRRRSGA